ncbi:MAG: hypothetical protein JW778_04645 [Candidatus Altiarchaeota archaeon]|nr:hypothetical protein [Candidatus Altiarchaeota archaeon]
MASKEEQILRVLSEDLQPLEDVRACMVVRKRLEGIVPITEDFKHEIVEIWEILKKTMDDLFDVVSHYSRFGLDKIYFELGKYDVMFFILPSTDTALVAIVPVLANRGLLEVEMENARRKILSIIEGD